MAAHTPTDFTVTDTHAAILRTVLEYPFDDTPRTIFLDWMEENGLPTKVKRYPVIRFWNCTMSRFFLGVRGMFSRRLITGVRLTDKRPRSPIVALGGLWMWLAEDSQWKNARGKNGLPAVIFDRLRKSIHKSQGLAEYHTVAKANAALSRACVDYGRELAGLRAIDWDTEGQS